MEQLEEFSLEHESEQILQRGRGGHRQKRIIDSDEEEFEPEYHQIKRLGLPFNKSKLKRGCWNEQENLIYLHFLVENRNDFESEAIRRKKRIFYFMSKVLKKRTPDQCRSHHQKLQLKCNDSVQELIIELSHRLGIPVPKPAELKAIKVKKADIEERTGEGIFRDSTEDARKWYKISMDTGALVFRISTVSLQVY